MEVQGIQRSKALGHLEDGDGAEQEVGSRQEVGIKDRYELRLDVIVNLVHRSCLVALGGRGMDAGEEASRISGPDAIPTLSNGV